MLSTSPRLFLSFLLACFVTACGGGVGGPRASKPLGGLGATMEGAKPGGGVRRSAWVATVDDRGDVEYVLQIDPGTAAQISACTLERAGQAPYDVLQDVEEEDAENGRIAGRMALSRALADALVGGDAEAVVRITMNDGAPPMVGSIRPIQSTGWIALLRTAGADTIAGAAGVQITEALDLALVVAAPGGSLGNVTAVRLEALAGGIGIPAPRVAQVQDLAASTDEAGTTLRGGIGLDLAEAAALLCAPERHRFVATHTTGPDHAAYLGAPAGRSVWALLADPSAGPGASVRGAATLRVLDRDRAELVVGVPVGDDVGMVSRAELSTGPSDIQGVVVADARSAADWRTSTALGVAAATLEPGFDQLVRILGHPAGFHASLDSTTGLRVGDFGRVVTSYVAELEGEAGTPGIDPTPSGGLLLTALDAARLAFLLRMDEPATDLVDGCGVYEGPVDAAGPLLVDMFTAADRASGDGATWGQVACDSVTFTRLLADPSHLHARARTSAAPDGVAWGAIVRGESGGAPAGLSYANVSAAVGQSVSVAPRLEGGAHVFVIEPALPSGLSLDARTGVISGRPVAAQAATTYVVSASNWAGSTTASLDLSVSDAPPVLVAYAGPIVIVVGQPLTAISPVLSGGLPTLFGIAPALPTGLVLDPLTGVLSGTPLVSQVATTFTITASNALGASALDIGLQVDAALAAPSAPNYAASASWPTGAAITALLPSGSAGAQVSFSVSPSLPAGLGLDSATGAITGTPLVVTTSTTYTITATNAAGSATATVDIVTPLGPPTSITYPQGTWIGSVLLGSIGSLSPTTTGGAVTSFTISPNLPLGLGLDGQSGVLSGIPLLLSLQATYTITASNAAGSTSTTIQVSVLP